MSVTVEPKPAELPLPGGSDGATVRLRPLLTGEVLVPPGMADVPPGRFGTIRGLGLGRGKPGWRWVPVPTFLIEHPTAGPIVVDTGLHPSVAIDPAQSFGRVFGRLAEVRMEPHQALPAQLRRLGIDPREVRTVVMTHLHFDHASGVCELPDATFVVDRREWESATAPRGLLRGYLTSQFDYGFDWRTVDYESPDIDSFETFGAGLDLFGDGSVRLLATPGHSAGHQSVLLRLDGGEALLCGDAAFTRRAIDEGAKPLAVDDEHRHRRSLREIQAFVRRTPGLVVVPGHDPDAWAELAEVY